MPETPRCPLRAVKVAVAAVGCAVALGAFTLALWQQAPAQIAAFLAASGFRGSPR